MTCISTPGLPTWQIPSTHWSSDSLWHFVPSITLSLHWWYTVVLTAKQTKLHCSSPTNRKTGPQLHCKNKVDNVLLSPSIEKHICSRPMDTILLLAKLSVSKTNGQLNVITNFATLIKLHAGFTMCNSICFSAHLNWKLKWVFLNTFCLSSVRLLTFHIFILFTRTTEPMLTKHGTKHPWVKGIQVYSNEKPLPFPRGDDKEKAKIW